MCAVERRRFQVGASPTRLLLQPEATGAGVEVTKCLKPWVGGSRIGDRAKVQADPTTLSVKANTDGPILIAISCLGASLTPAAGVRRGVCRADVRETCREADVACRLLRITSIDQRFKRRRSKLRSAIIRVADDVGEEIDGSGP